MQLKFWLIIVLVLAVACGPVDNDDQAQSPLTPTPSSSLEIALTWVPLDFADRQVRFADARAAAIASGKPDFRGIPTYLAEGTKGIPEFYSLTPQHSRLSGYLQILNDDIGLDQFANAVRIWTEGGGLTVPQVLVMKEGFQGDELGLKLLDLGYSRATHNEVAYYKFWDDPDGGAFLREHPLQLRGIYLNVIAPLGDLLLASPSVAEARVLIDLQQGVGSSLWDSTPHRVLAQEAGATLLGASFITPGDVKESAMRYLELAAEETHSEFSTQWSPMQPYDLALLGYQVREGQAEAVMALYYPDPDAAALDAEELVRRWDTAVLTTQQSLRTSAGGDDPLEENPLTAFCAPLTQR